MTCADIRYCLEAGLTKCQNAKRQAMGKIKLREIICEGCVKHSFLQDVIPSLYLASYLDAFGALYLELSGPLEFGPFGEIYKKDSKTGQV